MLVFTTLTKQALPLVRYWTGDISSTVDRPVLVRPHARPHGSDRRTERRHAHHPWRQRLPEPGRRRSRPGPELSPHFGLVVRRLGTLDEVEVAAEPRRDVFVSLTDERVRELSERTAALIRDTIGCTVAVTLVGAGEAPRSDGGKIQRITDLRSA